jgi:acyl-CoA thioesterase FadM
VWPIGPELLAVSGFRKDRRISDITATPLTITRHSTVTEDQIDHLGHMNVRFYGVNAHAGTAALLEPLVDGDDVTLRVVDVYTRHHREQLLGANLVVRSGVIDVRSDGLRLYHELVNVDTDDLAATFVHRLRSEDDAGLSVALPDAIAERARAAVVAVPAHGATRSIPLDTDPVASAPGLQQLRDRDLAMRKVRSVSPEECHPDGSYIRSLAPGLTWGGEPVSRRMPEMIHEGPDGERMGWASMETRMVIRRLPRLGDPIQSFSAVIGLADKTSHRIQWAYDVDRADLLTTFEVVNLAFDTGARRPMSIPKNLRAMEQSVLHPDLAPRLA